MLHWVWITALMLLALVLGIIMLCVVDYVGNIIGWDLYPSIFRSRQRIRHILKSRGVTFRVSSLGATHIDPRYLCVCIDVDTDAERDAILADNQLMEDFRHAILSAGYPAESVPLVGFSVESQQTVDREWGGNWSYVRK